jgi:Fe-S cluster assembly iron-binding protein IscA
MPFCETNSMFGSADGGQPQVIVDSVSLGLIKGSTVDYATELVGSQFRVVDNPQAKGSGCGCGVSWELNG